MWPKHLLATVGLGIEAIGVAMFFKWAPPQPDFQEYIGFNVGGAESDKVKRDAQAQRRFYKRMATVALTFVFVGLVLQVIDAWILD